MKKSILISQKRGCNRCKGLIFVPYGNRIPQKTQRNRGRFSCLHRGRLQKKKKEKSSTRGSRLPIRGKIDAPLKKVACRQARVQTNDREPEKGIHPQKCSASHQKEHVMALGNHYRRGVRCNKSNWVSKVSPSSPQEE